MKKLFALALAAALSVSVAATAQIVTPQPSPAAKLEQRIGITDFTLSYSRPSAKGRQIFGGLIPNGEIWRFGANAPTKLKFADTIKVGGQTLAPGEYAIYAIPSQSEWTILFGKNPNTQAGDFKQAEAAARVSVKPEGLPMNVETFTLDFNDITPTGANLVMMWEKTLVKVPIAVDYDRRVMAAINKSMTDISNYWAAANYYYETNKDLKQALEWSNKVVERNNQFWTVHLQAKIYKKMGDCTNATAAATKSRDMAQQAKNRDYVAMNERIIEECKGQVTPAAPAKKGKK